MISGIITTCFPRPFLVVSGCIGHVYRVAALAANAFQLQRDIAGEGAHHANSKMRSAHTMAIILNSDRALCPMFIIATLKYDDMDNAN